jgi:hypothetical protein
MMRRLGLLAFGLAGAVTGTVVLAQQAAPMPPTPTRITYPKGFETDFLRYDIVDKPDRKRARFLYVNRDAAARVKLGEPFPDGTVLVMEDHEAELDGAGNPVMDGAGRLRPTAKILAIAVMEKRAGWGATNPFPDEQDNGDWEYASFKPDGSANPVPLNACYSCHLPQKGALDYTFSGAALVKAAAK